MLRPSPMLALIKRDVLRGLRRWQNFAVAAALVFATQYFVAYSLPVEEISVVNVGNLAYALFYFPFAALLLCAIFVLPAQAAFSIVTEREQETIDPLRLTMLSDRQIVLAKFASTLIMFLLFAIALMPVAATLFFLVGIEGWQFFNAAFIVLATAVFLTSCGVCASALARSSRFAFFYSFLLPAIAIGLGLIGGFAAREFDLFGVPDIRVLYLILPMFSVAVFFTESIAAGSPYWLNAIPVAVWSAVFLFIASISLRRNQVALSQGTQRRLWGAAKALGVETEQRPSEPRDTPKWDAIARPRKTNGAAPWYETVLAISRKDTTRGWVYTGFCICTLIVTLLFLNSVSMWGMLQLRGGGTRWGSIETEVLLPGLVMQIAVFQFLSLGFCHGTFVRELEVGGLEMLRASLISPAELYLGKMLAAARTLLPLIIMVHLGSVVVYFQLQSHHALPRIFLSGLAMQALVCGISLALAGIAGLLARRRPIAIALYAALMGGYFLGLPLLALYASNDSAGPPGALLLSSLPMAWGISSANQLRPFNPIETMDYFNVLLAHSVLLAGLVYLGIRLTERVYWRRQESSTA